MRGLCADIDGVRQPLQCVHELRKSLPLPVQPGREHRIGNFFDAFHQIHQGAAMVLLDRCEADAAIAEQHRGHTMPARGRQQRVPHRLAIVMSVCVNPARRDQKPVGIDVALGWTLFAANSGDAAIGNRDIAHKGGLAGAVDDGAAANDDVVHGRRSLNPSLDPLWSVGPDSEISHGLDVHDAPGPIGGQRGYCAMQVFANAGLC
jgi:hypothetical protein